MVFLVIILISTATFIMGFFIGHERGYEDATKLIHKALR